MIEKLRKKLNGDLHLKDLLKGSAITFILKMSGMGLGFVLIYLISKRTGAEGVGFYNLMIQILTVLGMIVGLGMNISVLRYVGQFNSEKDRPKMHLLYRYFVRTVGPLSLVVGAIIYFGAGIIASWFGKDHSFAEALKWIAIILPFFTINQISVEFIRGLKKLQISELVRSVLRPLIISLGILVFFYHQLSKMDLIYLLVVALGINSLVSRITIWKELEKIPKLDAVFEKRELMKTSYPMMITSISTSLLMAMPIFVLNIYSTEKDIGIFSVAFRIAQLISLVLLIVNTIAAPKFAEMYFSNKKKDLQKLIDQSGKIMFWIGFVITLFVIIGSELILQLFGDEYSSGKTPLIILSIGQFFNLATGSVGALLNMTGKQIALRNIIFAGMLIVSVFYFILVPGLGVLGAAIVSTIGTILTNLIAVIYASRKLNLQTYFIPFNFNHEKKQA